MTENEFLDYLESVKTGARDCLASKFLYHIRNNPTVYNYFEEFAFDMIRKQPERGSAWMVANRVRWETSFSNDHIQETAFKVTNNFIALYARLFMSRHRQHEGYFRIKNMKAIVGL
tara:strand:+ start:108 stop:455 length:348 start_codon:yes stop_codon:yes gene_type:complete